MNFPGPQQTSGAEEREGLRCKAKFLSLEVIQRVGVCVLSAVFAFRTAVATGHFLGYVSGYEKAKGLSCKLRGKPAESSRKRRKRVAS